MDIGRTSVGGGYTSQRSKDNPDSRIGDADRCLEAAAQTYTKYLSSTLWGHASYINGLTRNVVWNETADAPLLYPYLLADSIGGDLKREKYSFSGGYADSRGRLAWGAELSYTALLQYRDVDPRPRNVVGKLDLSIGAMYRCIGNYYAGIGLGMMKYKQSNEVVFKSEMGVDKIYHLTGLGTHYNRFAGDGLSTCYDGYRFHLDLDIYPSSGRGAFATCRLSRFTFDNILSDLNKLPLAHAWHNQLEAEVGWLVPAAGHEHEWGATGSLRIYRRHGQEKIFGDATSAIYPVIGSNEMYADNAIDISVRGRWGRKISSISRFYLMLTPEWYRRTSAYIEPYNYRVVNSAALSAEAWGSLKIGRYWLFDSTLSIKGKFPYACELLLNNDDSEMSGLERAETGAFLLDSSLNVTVGFHVGILRTIADKFAISLEAEWNGNYWKSAGHLNYHAIKLNFIF